MGKTLVNVTLILRMCCHHVCVVMRKFDEDISRNLDWCSM